MKTGTLTKALIVIASVLAVSIIGAVVAGQAQKSNPPAPDNTSASGTKEPVSTTAVIPEQTTENNGNDTSPNPSSSSTKENNPPVTDPKPSSSSKDTTPTPPVTSPVQKAPANFKYNKTISSNSAAKYINTKSVIVGTRNDDGTVHLKISMYLVHYSIYTGGCPNSYIKIGDNISTFTAPAITRAENTKGETLLAVFEVDVIYGQTLSFSTLYTFNGTYNDVKLEGITSEATLTIK
ncbi:MAG: hypothetical protein IKX86_01720 [Clostridia bacterium]|nr:hypothetical protein [Clostridia bacterium]